MAISSASLLKYSSGISAAGKTATGDNQLLVERNYVTNSFAGFVDWSSKSTGYSFKESECIQYGGLIYSCVQGHDKSDTNYPGSATDQSEGYWVRRYPVLHRFTGYAGAAGNNNTYSIEHGLGSTDLTVQIYKDERAQNAASAKWVPVMMGFQLGDVNEENEENCISFSPTVAGTYRVVIVAAK